MSWVCWMEFCCCVIMDRSRKFSPVWNHFDLLTPNKVKCRLCSTELSYINKSTSSMLRHYRARHGGDEESADTRENTPVPKQAVDEAVVNMIIKDCQPLSLVENEGFRELLKLIIPSYVLPSRKVCLRKVIIIFFLGHNLWETFDMEVEENKRTSNATADSILEVQRYLAESNLPRKQDPLQYWKSNERAYPHLHELALKCLCSPCSSVPCERVFSKAGELVSKRRNRLGAKHFRNCCSSIKMHKQITSFLKYFISYD
ncbi:uncharacterized protein LOC115009315 [Cottoperca gobio]|uniref:Uncharacterized protein LOC115009315 n=1 Tax=Cottoperca gobio TaxID=56716 RepID=A0A6J2PUQ5_COTGO|nr:uncharacterized protein LOC115009315 [Cottoperca gobio]